jgi:glycosyltransferase involved in cell wall biosynthesis
MPAVTVGISFYNNEKTLAYAIQSVLGQSYKEFVLLLMDDGSTDSSLEIASSFRDARIKLVSYSKNAGMPTRLNEQIAASQTKYFARMDADDIMQVDRLRTQFNWMETNSEVDVCGCGIIAFDNDYNVLGIRVGVVGSLRPYDVLRTAVLGHVTLFGRTEWFRRWKYSASFRRLQDRDLWCRSFRDTRFGCIAEPLMLVREDVDCDYVSRWGRSLIAFQQILDVHGKTLAGSSATSMLRSWTRLKMAILYVAVRVGLVDMLLARRNTRVAAELIAEKQHELNSLLNTIERSISERKLVVSGDAA